MVDMITQKNISALLTARLASPFAAVTAGGAGNGVQVAGPGIQRSTIGLPRTLALIVPFSATLAAGKTLALTGIQLQTAPDGATWSTFSTFTDPGVVATGPANGGTVPGQVTLGAHVAGAMDWLRVVFTPTLNNNATDTASVLALLVFSGLDRLPAPS